MARYKKKNYPLIFSMIAIVAAIAGYEGWRDMHPIVVNKMASKLDIPEICLFDNQKSFSAMKPECGSVIILSGSFNTAGDFRPSEITPLDTDLGEVDLLFKFDAMPPDTDKAVEAIDKQIKSWDDAGTRITEIFIDWRPEKPDYVALEKLSAAVRLRERHDVWAGVYLKRAWLDDNGPAMQSIWNINKTARTFIYDYGDAQRKDETFAQTIHKLDNFSVPYYLIFRDTDADLQKLGMTVGKTAFFVGVAVPQKP